MESSEEADVEERSVNTKLENLDKKLSSRLSKLEVRINKVENKLEEKVVTQATNKRS